MLSEQLDEDNIVELPKPDRARPEALKEGPSEKEAYAIDDFQLTGPEWVRLLSLLCSVIADNEYCDLEVAKHAALRIDEYLQSSPKFQEEMKNLLKYGGPEVNQLIEKLKLPPWER